ncbi:GTP-binding protein [Calothrix sp. PCC 6303]|uniref:GTP-binding protein n=1 Tax=Calothrix sp. PCC 6303 TaxID=1170562 RepID=UPI0002A05594|nr:GTP-binding protein [Calothrix sp. PCC 6303]AFZ03167.1 small GTP-binding protein [Calothrix sp. PCC 6303]
MSNNLQETHINRARASLRQSLSWYGNFIKPGQVNVSTELAHLIKSDLESLNAALQKLEQNIIRIAAFGLVSRGKSAVLNALCGQKTLQTGPLNGVTQYPRSIRWHSSDKVEVELIDTPGLDEIAGEYRDKMARDVANQADLILFVVSGDITNTEYQALKDLRKSHKPLILVFNKIDLYPDTDRISIQNNLQRLSAENTLDEPLKLDQVVMVAAEPAPMEVRIEYSDGRVDYEWETPLPQIDELRRAVLDILNREGRSLLALNALIQARQVEAIIAQKLITHHNEAAEKLILQFAKYKALIISLNPIGVIDIVAGTIADLLLIRSLAKLYGLPVTSYEAGKILQKILLSSGSLLLTEVGTSLIIGLEKSSSAIGFGENFNNIGGFIGTAIAQGGVASYGTYSIGKSAQAYLLNGSTWGQFGVSTIIEEILIQLPKHRIPKELGDWEKKVKKGVDKEIGIG